MLSDFAEKKNLFDLKKQNFSNSKISHFFKGVNPYFWPKNANYLVYLDLVKIRLEIMLGDFAEKKETCFDYKKYKFSNSKISHFFKGVNPCFWPKNDIFFFI